MHLTDILPFLVLLYIAPTVNGDKEATSRKKKTSSTLEICAREKDWLIFKGAWLSLLVTEGDEIICFDEMVNFYRFWGKAHT